MADSTGELRRQQKSFPRWLVSQIRYGESKRNQVHGGKPQGYETERWNCLVTRVPCGSI